MAEGVEMKTIRIELEIENLGLFGDLDTFANKLFDWLMDRDVWVKYLKVTSLSDREYVEVVPE